MKSRAPPHAGAAIRTIWPLKCTRSPLARQVVLLHPVCGEGMDEAHVQCSV